MTRALKFTIYGKAVPKARPRLGKGGHTYTPKATQDYERRVQRAFREAYPDFEATQSPVRAIIQESRPMPTSWSGKQKQRMMGEPVTSKADLDNICKAVLDALNGTAYLDDSQVWNVQAAKLWDYDGSVTVTLLMETEEE